MVDNDFTTEVGVEEILIKEKEEHVVIDESVINVVSSGEETTISRAEEVPSVDITVGEVSGVSFGTRVVVNHNASDPNQHTIGAITGLREELDEIKRVKPVYADKINVANYYKWNNSTYNSHGHFVSLVNGDSSIEICSGSNILGVTVDGAGFIGGQDESNPRDLSYGLIATSGTVEVLCELDVEVGDCVTSNTRGYAAKSGSDYGYKVLARENKNGSEYAVIMLGVQADITNALGEELDNIEKRVGVNETNIISAINVANQAYSKVNEIDVSNQIMSGKVDNALGVVGKVELDVANLGNQVSNSALISVQARSIAESAAASAESMRNEAIESSNAALKEMTELKKVFDDKTSEISAEIDNTMLEIQATKENILETKEELVQSIDGIKADIDIVNEEIRNDIENTKADLSDTMSDVLSLQEDLIPLASWPEGSDNPTGIAGFVAKADENSAMIGSLVKWQGETNESLAAISEKADENESSISGLTSWKNITNESITKIEQKSNANESNIGLLTSWKSDVESDVESIASIKAQSDANKSSIASLTTWKDTASSSLSSVKQQSDANKASIDAITTWQGQTNESIAKVQQTSNANGASIQNLTKWQSEAETAIANVEQKTTSHESSINSLTSWQDGANTSIANVEQKASQNETKINSLTAWKGEASESIANVEQKATNNEASIKNLTTWQDTASESISAIQQTANQNSANISLVTSWKSTVEDDVASIASIKTTADEGKASIEQLVKKDNELSTTIAGVKTTADTNKASIESIVTWQDEVNPTINSVAGIKQTADGNAAQIEGITTWQGTTNDAMARIEQKADANGAYIQSTVANLNKYSVGPLSPSSGFASDQAKDILASGMVYVPTETHTEGDKSFTREFHYTWDGEKWVASNAVAVAFSDSYVTGVGTIYWYIPGVNNIDNEGITYNSHTLYKWESEQWVGVATLEGSSQSRAISNVKQTTNSIEASVTDLQGDYAGIRSELTNTQADVQQLTTWKNGEEANMASVRTVSDANGASVVISALQKNDESVTEMASLVLNVTDVNGGARSGLMIDADSIDFTGDSFSFATKRVIDNSVNLASNSVIKHPIYGYEGISNTPYPWNITKTEMYVGTYIDGSVFETGETYTLSYYFKKTAGTLVNIGGHTGDATEISFYLDGILQPSYANPVNIVDDTSEHYVEFTFTYNGGSDHIYIQPNRGIADSITYDLWNIQLEKGKIATAWSPASEDIVNGNDVVTRINASQEGVLIQGEKINIKGNATFSSLTTEKNGQTVIDGGKIDASTLTLSADCIDSGTYRNAINVSDNFIVDTSGNVTLNGSIVWGTGSSPTQVVYCSTYDTKPANGTQWDSFPSTDATGWHRTFNSGADYYGSYTYDGGATWGDPIQIVGENGSVPSIQDGYWYLDGDPTGIKAEGKDGSDASVTDVNVFNALTNNETMYGCFQSADNKLYINAAYIKSGTIESNLVLAGQVTAENITATGGWIGSRDSGFGISEKSIRNEYDISNVTEYGWKSLYMDSYYKLGQNSSLYTGYFMDSENNPINRDYVYVGTDGIGTYHVNSFDFNGITNASQTWMANGKLFSNSADITGKITATSGEFSAVTFNTGIIGGIQVIPQAICDNAAGLSSATWGITSATAYDGYNTLSIDSSGALSCGDTSPIRLFAGASGLQTTASSNTTGTNFYVTNSGFVNAKNIFCNNGIIALQTSFYDTYLNQGQVVIRNRSSNYSALLTASQLQWKNSGGKTATVFFNSNTGTGSLSGTWSIASGYVTSSWRGAKHDIEDVDDRYSALFDNLHPVRFKYNNGESDRYHTGFILDELKDAMDEASIDSSEFAAYCVDDEQTGEGGIRYEEIIALLVKEVQELKKEIKEIKGNE